eukprot:CAMPEP_0184491384 /NCGR_PEP_ID=MMETSP0113_2-20130426/20303_1 /TAXON_ID=91329 /ORGANISM="Norrisiella sphaerica, Strain BC52" /LENGTH=254 /DNA_ID=CAMNT_0026875737 /DNA_START=222 /DNA_END=983 /DNA_ORIENTATION=-
MDSKREENTEKNYNLSASGVTSASKTGVNTGGDTKKRQGLVENLIKDAAATGSTSHPWETLRTMLTQKLDEVVKGYLQEDSATLTIDGEDFDTRYKRIVDHMTDFKRPPFTLQRMCELLYEPKRYYRTTEKFLLAFSKMVCGVSYPADSPDRQISSVSEPTSQMDQESSTQNQGKGLNMSTTNTNVEKRNSMNENVNEKSMLENGKANVGDKDFVEKGKDSLSELQNNINQGSSNDVISKASSSINQDTDIAGD